MAKTTINTKGEIKINKKYTVVSGSGKADDNTGFCVERLPDYIKKTMRETVYSYKSRGD